MAVKKVAVYTAAPYANDQLFNPESPLNRDNCLAAFRALKSAIETAGGECRTFDVYLKADSAPDAVIFLDIPERPVDELLGKWAGALKCVILQEPVVIIPRNWELPLHAQFDLLFTWNDDLADGKRYFKYNYGNVLPASIPKEIAARKKLCVVIAGNQKSEHPEALYTEREEAIRWFEANHPEDFDLYGRGWDEYQFRGPKLWRALNRIKPLRRLLAPAYPSYRGAVSDKTEVMKKYRFALCYENSGAMPGYISEKIFDCFAAGCLPVYLGAPNVNSLIPAECFLDKRAFPDYGTLYAKMKGMNDTEYLSRLDAIEAFLKSEAGRKFSTGCFAETVVSALPGLRL